MLKMTKIELEQISDIRILDIIERMKRGGLCFVGSKKHVEVNNRYVENSDINKPENYLMYWDANNSYGWAMSQLLPYKDLEFSDISLEDVLNTPDDNEEGYILEIDLHVPYEIHDKLKEFPVCPEIIAPNPEMFSDYQNMLVKNNMKVNTKNTKLVPHLMDKHNYLPLYEKRSS